MPDFEHDDFTLFAGEFRQATQGQAFLRRFPLATFKPAMRLKFPRQPSPEAAAMIKRPIPKTAQTIVERLFGWSGPLHQTQESLLQNIFGLAVAQAQRPAVKNDLRGFRFV